MGLFAILPCLVAALLILGHATTGSGNFVVMSTSHVWVRSGHTATLPCWLSPRQSIQALEVQWFHKRDSVSSPILHKKVSSPPSYTSRVSFGLHCGASCGLGSGDVSLKLVKVTPQDSGEYTCSVSSYQNHDSATVTLAVTETGGPLRLSAVWTDSKMVNVSCGSEGWYPEPYLRWSSQNGALTPQSVQYGGQSPGPVSVHSWVLVPSSSEIICTVGLQGGEEKESRIHLSGAPETGPAASCDSASAGLAVLAVLLAIAVIVAIVFGTALYRKRGGQRPLPEDRNIKAILTAAKKNYVNVSIPENGHPHLLVKHSQTGYTVKDRQGFPNGTKVSCLTAITGTHGFFTGEYYWEVAVGDDQAGLKQSWWLGVTTLSESPMDEEYPPTASTGYWFLSSSPENPEFLQLSTEPAALLPVGSKPQTVGVYLNYERGELAFYNVEKSRIIGSLKADFEDYVYPLFNPGLFDAAPLKILHKNKNDPCVTNNEEHVALNREIQ